MLSAARGWQRRGGPDAVRNDERRHEPGALGSVQRSSPAPPGESAGAGAGGGGAPGHPIRDASRPPDPCYVGGPASGGEESGGSSSEGRQQWVARLAAPGAYVVTLTVNGRDYSRSVTVLEDVR